MAVAGCRVAALAVLAAAILWVANPASLWVADPRMPYDRARFCQISIDAVTTLWDTSYLRAPSDERCAVRVGPRTVAAVVATGEAAALLVLGIPFWLPWRRPRP
ncbi:MAG: hypothetical protein ABI628_10570 [Chloroflexota bacterium]